ncbi:MAG: hypothetical protein AUI93_06260 [Crenarchaeota archaeon 13_1_40CM_3_52_10]|nr:MAG: hypothetical protein AUI93_06260 [Crenarchaeota archaeon 13_1_40CM_3_52_10]OLE69167.1 MAG: hypothetical protein AUF78_12405 [archaeon 13_1_20CM_2_51_12]
MSIRFSLHEGNKVLLDFPLSEKEWQPEVRDLVLKELSKSEADLDSLSEICDFFSNKKRLQMVSHMIRDCENSATFTDLLKVAANPKYVSDLVNRAPKRELVVKDKNGYSVSPIGVGSFILLSIAINKLLRNGDSINSDDKSFEEE